MEEHIHIATGDASAPRRSAPNALNTSTTKNVIAIEQWRRVAMSLPSPRRERLLRTCAQLERVYQAAEVRA